MTKKTTTAASASKKPKPADAKPAKAPEKKPAKASEKPAAKSAPAKPTPKKTDAKPTKPAPAKSEAKADTGKKTPTKPAPKAPVKKDDAPVAPAPTTPAPAPAPVNGTTPAANAPKGITIVNNSKTIKKNKPKPKIEFPVFEPLLKPGAKWKPLIPSGPAATPVTGALTPEQVEANRAKAPKMPKKELDKYRAILLRKRAELIGDISNMEEEALRQSASGSLSSLPQHMAEQGSDTFDQSLSLDLAQVDRKLLKEIDAALERIEAGTYGICELTGVVIKPERLEELPWTRHTIEAARELERRPTFVQSRSVQYESESE